MAENQSTESQAANPAENPASGPAVEVPAAAVPSREDHFVRAARTWVRDLFVAIAIAAFIIIFLYQPVKVEGTSMMPELDDQERIFINKFVYRMEPIERGDVVVFRYPRDPGKSYIKRVIAVAGDHVKVMNGALYLNGKKMLEPYVPERFADNRSYPEVTVPTGEYFVMGDHRSLSSDSRDFGPVDESLIYGKAVFAYWPVDKLGVLR